MRGFYFKDKKTNVAYRGFQPTTDIDCPPFDYFRYGHAYNAANLFQDILKVKCPIRIPDEFVRKFVLKQTDDMIAVKLANSTPNLAIHQLIMDENLSNKDRNKLLKNVTLTPTDIMWLNKEAQELGYLMDIYHEEKYPEKFDGKKHPFLIQKHKDGTMGTVGRVPVSRIIGVSNNQ